MLQAADNHAAKAVRILDTYQKIERPKKQVLPKCRRCSQNHYDLLKVLWTQAGDAKKTPVS